MLGFLVKVHFVSKFLMTKSAPKAKSKGTSIKKT